MVITIPTAEAAKPASKPIPTPQGEITQTEDVKVAPAAGAEKKSEDGTAPTGDSRPRFGEGRRKSAASVRPCSLTVSEPNVTLQTGGDLAVVVGRSDDNELDGLTAVSTSPDQVTVRHQPIEGMRTRALFVLHAAGTKPGVYQVLFEMPCGKREVVVKVK